MAGGEREDWTDAERFQSAETGSAPGIEEVISTEEAVAVSIKRDRFTQFESADSSFYDYMQLSKRLIFSAP
jgi:hypothetical protein